MAIDIAPRMPCTGTVPAGHREKQAPSLYNACVARPVKPAELKVNDAARKAMQDEWDRLRAVERPDGTHGVWDEDKVEGWDVVRRHFQRLDQKVYVGLVFGIVVEKNHELDVNDKRRKYKGRAVFQGNSVLDEYGNWAIFAELGSSPATMEAARSADAYGLSRPRRRTVRCGTGLHASLAIWDSHMGTIAQGSMATGLA